MAQAPVLPERRLERALLTHESMAGQRFPARCGERLVAARYLCDSARNCLHRTVELIVETVPRRPRQRLWELRSPDAKRLGIADRILAA